MSQVSAELIDCNGTRMWVRTNNGPTMDHMLANQHFGKAIHPAITNLHEGAVVLDAGAHIGTYSLALLSHRPDLNIIAMEPVPYNYGFLIKNRDENHALQIRPLQFALAKSQGLITLNNLGNSGAWSAVADFATISQSMPVRCMTVTDLVNIIPFDHIDMIKLDIEGMEWDIISTIPLDIMDDISVFDIDLHVPKDDIQTLLGSMGFIVEDILNWATQTPSGLIAYREE